MEYVVGVIIGAVIVWICWGVRDLLNFIERLNRDDIAFEVDDGD